MVATKIEADSDHLQEVLQEVLQDVNDYPSLEAFLNMPLAEARKVAPATLILATGGTRRRAALDGLSPNSIEYVQLTRLQMLDAIELLLEHGVCHVFVPILAEGNFLENTAGYREKLLDWINHGLAGDESLSFYAARGWQVRLIGAEMIPELAAAADTLQRQTQKRTERCVWYTAFPSSEAAWDQVFRASALHGATTRREAIRAVFGQDVPVDDVVLLDFGKPQVITSAVSPLLIGKLHCYWRQSLGYALTPAQLRAVIYDYAYTRRTWLEDKTGRAGEVLRYRTIWDDPPILGLGMRLGPFWFPNSTLTPLTGINPPRQESH